MEIKTVIKRAVLGVTKIFRVFPIDNRKIFLTSFDGTAVGHDSKAFVKWCTDNGKDFDFVWGVKDREYQRKFKLKNTKFVKLKSLSGIYHMLTSKVLIYNINPPSYLSFRKQQVLINTWHGFPCKVAGKYIDGFDKRQFNTTTCFLSDAEICTQTTIRDAFEYEGEVLECGTPRTDIFFTDKRFETANEVKSRLGIDKKDKVVLYAPTFRGDFSLSDLTIDINRTVKNLTKRFGGEWKVLYRLHPMISKQYSIDVENALDVSLYEDTQDLLCTADVLITDYSSTNWDFSLMKKPVFIYADDLEKYNRERGLVVPIEKWPFPVAKNNDELEEKILSFNYEEYVTRVEKYHIEMGNYDKGKSCRSIYEYITKKGAG